MKNPTFKLNTSQNLKDKQEDVRRIAWGLQGVAWVLAQHFIWQDCEGNDPLPVTVHSDLASAAEALSIALSDKIETLEQATDEALETARLIAEAQQ